MNKDDFEKLALECLDAVLMKEAILGAVGQAGARLFGRAAGALGASKKTKGVVGLIGGRVAQGTAAGAGIGAVGGLATKGKDESSVGALARGAMKGGLLGGAAGGAYGIGKSPLGKSALGKLSTPKA